MTKYIHYCWFGGKPLSKLTKKCIKSWEKYLPDFKIKQWDETNCDINECQFVKEAYKNKKWAFVADYFRSKILKENGGLYFDTDMEVTKNIDKLLEDKSFLGIEDSGHIAVGVWWEKEKDGFLPSYLYEYYNNLKKFDVNNMYSISIPKLVTNELTKYGFDKFNIDNIQNINDMYIYPREYFYPLSYDRQDNVFTDNTCMIHYYDATWVPNWEKRQIKLIRLIGKEKAIKVINIVGRIKHYIKRLLKLILYPLVIYRRKKHEAKFFAKRKEEFINNIEKIDENKYITIHNKDWLGTTYATKELFENTLSLPELYEKDDYEFYAKKILDKKPTLIIFSAFAQGWEKLIDELKKIDSNLRIKVLWHGSNAVHSENYDFEMFKIIFKYLNKNKIESIGFVKKSMYQTYKKLGYNVEFVRNTITISNEIKEKLYKKQECQKGIKIGLYASGDRWVKNFYNQLAAASLIKDSIIDIIPLSTKTKEFANILKCEVVGFDKNITREELFERLAQNDVNIYTTFVDCAPITPLESLELGVPCITGNNHHYWEETELEKYLVVDKADNPIEIASKIELCLKNKNKILELYNEWKRTNDIESKKSVNDFIKKW